MNILSWFQKKKQDREREEQAMAEMRRADDEPVPEEPAEVKLSQLRD